MRVSVPLNVRRPSARIATALQWRLDLEPDVLYSVL
jgi:hypothetical protein